MIHATIAMMKPILRLLGACVAVTALSGCINVETDIELAQDGSGTLGLVFEIDQTLYQIGVFDEDPAERPVPVRRADFEYGALLVDGVELERYEAHVDDESGIVTVTARLSFDSPESLSSYYAGSEGAVGLGSSGSTTTYRMLVVPGGGAAGTALESDLEDYRLSYSVRAPSPIITVSDGEIAEDGRTARIDFSLGSVADTTSPIYWEVTWQSE